MDREMITSCAPVAMPSKSNRLNSTRSIRGGDRLTHTHLIPAKHADNHQALTDEGLGKPAPSDRKIMSTGRLAKMLSMSF
jgi:hypothetical protein